MLFFYKLSILKAEASLRRLRQSKFDLEQEIGVKESTLRIDAEHCMNALRRNMVLPQPWIIQAHLVSAHIYAFLHLLFPSIQIVFLSVKIIKIHGTFAYI